MLVTLQKQDLIFHFFGNDIENFMVEKESGHFKRQSFKPSIRQEVWEKFESVFGIAAEELIQNFTYKELPVDKRLLQRRINNALDAILFSKTGKESHPIGEFQKKDTGKIKKVIHDEDNDIFSPAKR